MFIHSFNTHLFSTYDVLNSALGAKETEVNKTGECLPTHMDIITGVAKGARLQVESDVGDRERKGLFCTTISGSLGRGHLSREQNTVRSKHGDVLRGVLQAEAVRRDELRRVGGFQYDRSSPARGTWWGTRQGNVCMPTPEGFGFQSSVMEAPRGF